MFERPEVMRMAAAASANAAARLGTIAQNAANADTPGYRAQDVASFRDSYASESSFRPAATRPGHFAAPTTTSGAIRPRDLAGGHMSPNGNNVSLEGEMMRAAGVRADHDMALSIYKSALNILRASLGRH